MFSNLFNSGKKGFQLFQDSFLVAEIEDANALKNCQLLQTYENIVSLYSSLSREQNKQYYEIVYANRKRKFMIYHHEDKETATQMFDKLKSIIFILNRSLQAIRSLEETLVLMMKNLKEHPNWTATHLAAVLGIESHFTHFTSQVEKELNVQVSPDLLTPLHLAIINGHFSIVQYIIRNLEPNLDLVDAERHSILHFAAISSVEILNLILHLPGMFDRILWKDDKGSTALHLACFAENFINVCEFLKFGLSAEMLTLPKPKLTFIDGQPNDRPRPKPNSKIIKFEEDDFADLDFTPSIEGAPSDIVSAGGILHWVKHCRLMDKLMQYDFDINSKNMNGDTPLHIMVKRDRLLCVLILLCNGAKLDLKNMFGNTPLYNAAQMDNKVIAQTLIVFDADINVQNNKKISIRHEAASKGAEDGILLYLLSSIGAKRCLPDMTGCKDGCKHDGKFEGRFLTKLFELDSDRDKFFRSPKIEKIIKETMEATESPSAKQRRVNLLTLDGGGVKGLLSIQVLMEIEKYLKYSISHYFRWISGTSTGSIIATCLANGKSLKHIRNLYFNLKSKLFVGQRPYSSELLEKFLKEEFGADLTMADLKNNFQKHIIIPAVLVDRSPMQLHIFRSFSSCKQVIGKQSAVNLNDVKSDTTVSNSNCSNSGQAGSIKQSTNEYVWKACRASGAAPTYFRAFGPYIDGGMIANNPTLDALVEIENYNFSLHEMKRENEQEHLNLVLSVGCGRFAPKKTEIVDLPSMYTFNPMEIKQNFNHMWNFFNLMLSEVCNTNEHVVNRAEAACSQANIPYFRINALLSHDIELDEKFEFKIINAMWETKRYMFLMNDQVLMLANYLEKTTDLCLASSLKSKASEHCNSLNETNHLKAGPSATKISLERKASARNSKRFNQKNDHKSNSFKRKRVIADSEHSPDKNKENSAERESSEHSSSEA